MPDLNTYNMAVELGKKKDEVNQALVVTGTTSGLAAIGNALNTTGKFTGKRVFNTTTGILVIAAGGGAAAIWKNSGTGATEHTPV
jgi:hypothetical protein